MTWFRSVEEEVREASIQDAIRARVSQVTATFTPEVIAQFGRQAERAPQVPPEIHVALALEGPLGEAMLDQVAMEYDASVPLTLSPRGARAIRVSQRYLRSDAANEELNRLMGTRFGSRDIVGEAGSRITNTASRGWGFAEGRLRRLPGGDPVINRVEAVGEPVINTTVNAVRDTTRTLMPPLQFPEQFFQGVGRDLASIVNPNAEINEAVDQWWRNPTGSHPVARATDQTDLGVILNQATTDLRAGRLPNIDQGEGWFTAEDSAVFQQRQFNERTMGTLPNGQTYTLGRSVAWIPVSTGLIEPGSIAYDMISGLVDGAVALGVPGPELAMAQGAGRLRAGVTEGLGGVAELTHRSGAAQGLIRQYDRGRWVNFLYSRRAQPMIDFLVDSKGDDGWWKIWQASNGSLTPQTVSSLTDATTPSQVRDILFMATETGQKPTLRTLGGRRMDQIGRAAADRSSSLRRLFGRAVGAEVDMRSPQQFTETIEGLARDFRFGSDDTATWISRAGRASSEAERYDVYTGFMGRASEVLSADHGVNAQRARDITKFMKDELDTTRATWMDMLMMGDDDWSNWTARRILMDDGAQAPPGAFLLNERAHTLPVPNTREVRRATSNLRPLFELSDAAARDDAWIMVPARDSRGRIIKDANGTVMRQVDVKQAAARLTRLFGQGWEQSTAAALWAQNNIWKTSRLLRFGYTLRVTPEEFGRRIWDGQTWVTHPGGIFSILADRRHADEVARMFGGRDGMGRIVEDIIDVDGVKLTVPAGFDADSPAMRQVLVNSETLMGNRDPYTPLRDALRSTRTSTEGFGRGEIGTIAARMNNGDLNPGFVDAWRDQLLHVGSDVIAQRVARNGIDDTWNWLLNLPQGQVADEFAPAARAAMSDEALQASDNWFLRELQTMSTENGSSILDNPDNLRGYLMQVDRRIRTLTGGDDDLLRVVRRGVWEDDIDLIEKADLGLNPNVVAVPRTRAGDTAGAVRRWINTFFDATVTLPSNKLNRIPAFNHYYEEAVTEMAPLADNAEAYVRGAERAGVRPSSLDAIRSGARGNGFLTTNQIDVLAQRYAADKVSKLLYDATQKSNFFEIFRLMFPFGEAYREVVTAWARLMRDKPFTAMRYGGMVAREGTRGDAGQTYLNIMGIDRESEGFFYEDQYGEVSFYYPFSGQLFAAAGLPGGGFEGAVSNLNIATEIAPSAGPFGMIPISMALPNRESWDGVRDLLFPFGEPQKIDDIGTWMPSWFAKAYDQVSANTPFGNYIGFTSDQSANRIANGRMAAARALASTGKYDLSTEEGLEALFAEADSAAFVLGMLQAAVQGAAPTSPKTFYEIIGPNGENVEMAVALEQLYEMYETDPDNAVVRWVGEYGLHNILMTQGFTTTTVWGGMPLHQEGWDWYREYPEMSDRYKNIYGLFSPGSDISEGDPDNFVNEAYQRQRENGEREGLNPNEWAALAQNKVASAIYRRLRSDLYAANGYESLSPEQNLIKQSLYAELKEMFPNWNEVQGIGGRTPVRQLMDDFERAYNDEYLTATPAGQQFIKYWDVRTGMLQLAEAEGLTNPNPDTTGGWRTSNDGLRYRTLLRTTLEVLAAQEPDFAEMADVLMMEFKNDEEEL